MDPLQSLYHGFLFFSEAFSRKIIQYRIFTKIRVILGLIYIGIRFILVNVIVIKPGTKCKHRNWVAECLRNDFSEFDSFWVRLNIRTGNTRVFRSYKPLRTSQLQQISSRFYYRTNACREFRHICSRPFWAKRARKNLNDHHSHLCS